MPELDQHDRAVLGFAAEHRIFLPDHVRALLGVSAAAANERLRALDASGLILRREVFAHEPALHRITRAGLAAVGSSLESPRIDLRCYEHDIGLAWLWLASHDGVLGPMAQVIGERRLRSGDARRPAGAPPLAVRLGGLGPGGRERLHYPDLLLVDPHGRRIALELELTRKHFRRLDRILDGYAIDSRIDAVVYVVTSPGLGRAIAGSAARLGMQSRVYVQLVGLDARSPGADSGRLRTRAAGRDRTAVR